MAHANETEDAPLLEAAKTGTLNSANITALLGEHTDVNIADSSGQTPLMIAASHGHCPTVKALCDKGADIGIADKEGRTAVLYACMNGHKDVVIFLYQQGSDMKIADNNGTTALMYASLNGSLELVKCFCCLDVDVNKTDKSGRTALMYAVREGHTDVVEFLCQFGANLKIRDRTKKDALAYASTKNLPDVVKILCRPAYKGNIDGPSSTGMTALHLGAAHGHTDVVQALLDAGACCKKKDKSGRTPENLAKLIGHSRVQEMLRKAKKYKGNKINMKFGFSSYVSVTECLNGEDDPDYENIYEADDTGYVNVNEDDHDYKNLPASPNDTEEGQTILEGDDDIYGDEFGYEPLSCQSNKDVNEDEILYETLPDALNVADEGNAVPESDDEDIYMDISAFSNTNDGKSGDETQGTATPISVGRPLPPPPSRETPQVLSSESSTYSTYSPLPPPIASIPRKQAPSVTTNSTQQESQITIRPPASVTEKPTAQPRQLPTRPNRQPPPVPVKPDMLPPPVATKPDQLPPPVATKPDRRPPPVAAKPDRRPPPVATKLTPPNLTALQPSHVSTKPHGQPPPVAIRSDRQPPPVATKPKPQLPQASSLPTLPPPPLPVKRTKRLPPIPDGATIPLQQSLSVSEDLSSSTVQTPLSSQSPQHDAMWPSPMAEISHDTPSLPASATSCKPVQSPILLPPPPLPPRAPKNTSATDLHGSNATLHPRTLVPIDLSPPELPRRPSTHCSGRDFALEGARPKQKPSGSEPLSSSQHGLHNGFTTEQDMRLQSTVANPLVDAMDFPTGPPPPLPERRDQDPMQYEEMIVQPIVQNVTKCLSDFVKGRERGYHGQHSASKTKTLLKDGHITLNLHLNFCSHHQVTCKNLCVKQSENLAANGSILNVCRGGCVANESSEMCDIEENDEDNDDGADERNLYARHSFEDAEDFDEETFVIPEIPDDGGSPQWPDSD